MGEFRFEMFAVDSQSYLRYFTAEGGIPIAGTGWGDFRKLFYGGHGVLYGLHNNGSLYWFRRGWDLPTYDAWDSAQLTGSWGDIRLITGAGDGVIYAVHNNGNLYRYHHTGWQSGASEFESWNPPAVGGGWGGMREIFACQQDVLYAVDSNGDLRYYRITATGGIPVNGDQAGNGWGGFSDLFASGDIIHGVQSDQIFKYLIPGSGGTPGGLSSSVNPGPTFKHWAGGWFFAPYLQHGSYYLRSELGHEYEQSGRHNEPTFAWGYRPTDPLPLDIVTWSEGPDRRFEVIVLSDPNPNVTFALRAPNGKYVSSELDGWVTCNREQRGEWETFTLAGMPPGGPPSLAQASQSSSYHALIRDWQGRYMRASYDSVIYGARVKFDALAGLPPDHATWKDCYQLYR